MSMHQNDIDHEVERRRAEFDLGITTENERMRHRSVAWVALLIIGFAAIIFGTASIWFVL